MRKEAKTHFLTTPTIEKIQRAVEHAVKNNKWICITGRAGSGKTTIRDYYVHKFIREQHKYIVIEQQSFISSRSRMNLLMGRMLRAIGSDEATIPNDIESRYIRLRTALLRANRMKHKVLLIIDEAQDSNKQTLRDLKKLHELSGPGQRHLFTIIMFSKDVMKMDALLDCQELGYRIKRYDMHNLSADDIIFFAENYGVSFGKGDSARAKKNYFIQIVDSTPLSVRDLCDYIHDCKDFDGVVKLEQMQKYASRNRNGILQDRGISFSDIQKEWIVIHKGRAPSRATISLALNNKIHTKMAKDLRGLVSNMVAEKTKERMRT